MSYQVIARKYRPQRFEDVVGQEHVTRTLAQAIQQKRVAHAYLFAGPRGTGKTTIARIFAKCLNAVDGPRIDFAEGDPRCLEIAEGRSLDVLEIDGASNRGIEEIRELRETVKYAPASARFKVYIIDEVHMLTKEAFNALLKTLEEPPAHVKFMFATTEPEKVLPTILSRCQRFDLRRIPMPLIVRHLADIAGREKVQIDEAALQAVARGADGAMRDAESALDQLISFCGERIVEADVLSMFGLTGRSQILAMTRAILGGDVPGALRQLNELANNGKDLGRLLADLLGHFRNLLVYQVAGRDLALLEVTEAEAESLAEQARQIDADALTRIMETLAQAEGRLREAASKRIMIEVTLLKAIQARQAVNIDSVLKQLQELRAQKNPAAAAAPPSKTRPASGAPVASRVSVPPVDIRSNEATAAGPGASSASAGNPAAEALVPLWAQMLERARQTSPFLRSYLLEAQPVSLEGSVLTVGFGPEFADHVELVDNSKNQALIQSILGDLGYPGVQVRWVRAEGPAPSDPAAPAAGPRSNAPVTEKAAAGLAAPEKPPPVDFRNDPLIQKALEIFKGQIVDVRA